MSEPRRISVSASGVLLFIGIVLIVLKGFGIHFGPCDIGWLGLAFAFASFMFP